MANLVKETGSKIKCHQTQLLLIRRRFSVTLSARNCSGTSSNRDFNAGEEQSVGVFPKRPTIAGQRHGVI